MGTDTKKKISFGCLFWVLFVLLIAALFYINRETISFVLDKTNAKSIFLKNKEEEPVQEEPPQAIPLIQTHDDADKRSGDGSSLETVLLENILAPPDGDTQSPDQTAEIDLDQIGQDTPLNTEQPLHQDTDSSVQQAVQNTAESSALPEIRATALYWIRVDTDGKLSRQRVVRMLPKSDAPMSNALTALFAAPSMEEAKQGLRTLVPLGTKLRSAWVKDGIAFIDVSDEFQFNQYGIEGALAQLSQVVFTATEFTTVKSVQFLIEGQKKEYLGAEGVWIGSPLSRTSF